jgi:hypothetical protein
MDKLAGVRNGAAFGTAVTGVTGLFQGSKTLAGVALLLAAVWIVASFLMTKKESAS